MYILGKTWRDGYLDYHRSAGHVRVATKAWWPLEYLTDVFIEQPKSLRRVWNYFWEVGLLAVIRKVRSRFAERLRDQRVLAVGIGEIAEGGENDGYEQGCPVIFLAACHPECVERLVLPVECVARIPRRLFKRFSSPHGIYLFTERAFEVEGDWTRIARWSEFSGIPMIGSTPALLRRAEREFQQLDPKHAKLLPVVQVTPIKERSVPIRRPETKQLAAVVFGLGNYAKTCLIPNLDPRIKVTCVHEIDPTQIGPLDEEVVTYDTCDCRREDEKYDVYFMAGYHHTHADLAMHAVQSGAVAVVEKPLVTTWEQLSRLMSVLQEHPGRLFACFQKRYNPLWDLARRDLGLSAGQPVHYHCIVYEVPLPGRHWYKWPCSGSRLISNGCHWIDHFLYMNAFSPPVRYDLWKGSKGDLHVSAELDNGAVFGMCVTDAGSQRVGMQEYIELRANGVTVKVANGGRYFAEDRRRIIRKKRINKYKVYKRMYGSICRRILNGESGDSSESIERSCDLVLTLERMYQDR